MSLALGSKLGPYELLSPLGAGGMGTVYRARDERLRRDVAIKVLAPDLFADDEALRRFRREALTLAKLSHANIATVYDVGEQDGITYLVMEFVPGETLAARLSSGPMSIRDALRVTVEIAAALEDAHEHGVVHRDLKPANVVVTPKGHVKVLDFGIAKLVEPSATTAALTDAKGAVGTPLYMSPEQVSGDAIDARTDLWSLGVVLYETLTGKPPFSGGSALALFSAITSTAPASVRASRTDIPRSVEAVVSRALEKDVANRYQTAAELGRDASAALDRLDGTTTAEPPGRARLIGALAATVVLLAAASGWFYHRFERRQWAREVAIPQFAALREAGRQLEGIRVLQQAAAYLPHDSVIQRQVDSATMRVHVVSSPPGASVEIQDYATPDGRWTTLGTTPLDSVVVPRGYFRWRVRSDDTRELISAPPLGPTMSFDLAAAATAPAGMVPVPGGPWGTLLDFVGWVGPYDLPSFFIDRLEITNRQYQEFVDRGGYARKEFWKEKFVMDGRELSWDDAMPLLRDRTGRSGPATWTGGHYPQGQADFPVQGVSFYEAAAYAEFVGKSLPTYPQWYKAAPPAAAAAIVPQSNINRSSVAPVASFAGLGPYGTLDMAGNVREWTINLVAPENRLSLGGAWDSQAYLYAEPLGLPPFDRSPENGIRCVKNLSPVPDAVKQPIKALDRDWAKLEPVSDEVFAAYRVLYDYSKTPLEPKVESTKDAPDWQLQRITFTTAYDDERMAAYLFVPKRVKPPYQTVVFFPSANVLERKSSGTLGDTEFFDYIVQSGRAVLYPVYQETYERRLKHVWPGTEQGGAIESARAKDFGRSLDYLATRADIDTSRIAYLGVSMGAAEGVLYTTLEQRRLKTALFFDGGYFLFPPPRGGDQADFAPRLKLPVLMINGRYDFSFSLERAQLPLFRALGAPPADKKHVVVEAPHGIEVQRPTMVRETLDWLDKYLGRVK